MGNMDKIMENKRLAIGAINNVDKMLEFYKIDEQNDLKKKYAPFVPQMRPWLVIVEVNMTEVTLNTECTGAVLSPWWVVTSRSCVCGDSYGCNLQLLNEKQKTEVFVYPGFRYIKKSKTFTRLLYPYWLK